jgi:putative AlgH/UPF0301 family transcriptional regulator
MSYDFRKINKGQLLIAEPSISGDLSFNRSVILWITMKRRISRIYHKQTIEIHHK